MEMWLWWWMKTTEMWKSKKGMWESEKSIFFVVARVSLPSSSFNISEFTQQDVRKKRKAKRLRVTNVTAYLFCRDLHLTLMFSGFLQKRSV